MKNIIKGKIISKRYNKEYKCIELIIVEEKEGRKISNKVIFSKSNPEYNNALKCKKEDTLTVDTIIVTHKDGFFHLEGLSILQNTSDEVTSFEFHGKVKKLEIKTGTTGSKSWKMGKCEVYSNDNTFSLNLIVWNELTNLVIDNQDNFLNFIGYTKICYNQFYDNYYTDIIIKDVKVVENNEGKNA